MLLTTRKDNSDMTKIRLLLLTAVLAALLIGCERDVKMHVYKDTTEVYSSKFDLDLSDRTRFDEGGVLRISEAGVWHIRGKAEGNKRIVVDAHPRAEVTLMMEGYSLSCESDSALYIKRAGRVRILLTDGSESFLGSVGAPDTAALRSDVPLTVEGAGTLYITSDSGEGMNTDGRLDLLGGSIDIVSKKTALHTEGDLNLGGTGIKARSDSDGILASGSRSIVTVGSGTHIINAGDRAISSGGSFLLSGGSITAESSSVGIRAREIKLMSGRADICASRAAFDSDVDILIEGGEALACVHNADGECEIVSGGGVVRHTGGNFVSLAEGHARFSQDTAINRINITLSEEVSVSNVRVTDTAGENVLLSEASHLPAKYLTVSSPVLKQGERYRVWAGDINTKITQGGVTAEKTVSVEPASMTKLSHGGLNYLLYTPAYVSEILPMVVFLHGSGEKGDELDILTLAPSLPGFLADGTLELDAYVIIPQCPATEKNWQSVTDKLEAVIEHSRNTLPILKNKVSLTGHSMGGNGVWVLAIRHPERYSKAAPLSGWVDMTEDNLKALSRIPIWDLVGELDTAVPPIESKPMTDALKAAGANVRVTVFEGAKHNEVPTLAYLDSELGLMDWLLG